MTSQLLHEQLHYRENVQPSDCETVRDIVSSSGFFGPEEIAVAVELVEERLATGMHSGYFFLFAEYHGDVLGYTCFGPIPGTMERYDLYWIAVRDAYRGHGIGSLLLARSEEKIVQKGGRRIYVETSSRDLYAPTQAFYRVHSYRQEAVLSDYYAPGDSKIIYVKQLKED